MKQKFYVLVHTVKVHNILFSFKNNKDIHHQLTQITTASILTWKQEVTS